MAQFAFVTTHERHQAGTYLDTLGCRDARVLYTSIGWSQATLQGSKALRKVDRNHRYVKLAE